MLKWIFMEFYNSIELISINRDMYYFLVIFFLLRHFIIIFRKLNLFYARKPYVNDICFISNLLKNLCNEFIDCYGN